MQEYTLEQLKLRTLEQANLDPDDLSEFDEAITGYINEGYAELLTDAYRPWVVEEAEVIDGAVPFRQMGKKPVSLMGAWVGKTEVAAKLDEANKAVALPYVRDGAVVLLRYRYLPPALEDDQDIPKLPKWAHGALADYATFRVYTNGNPQKQNRGLPFLDLFNKVKRRMQPFGADMSGFGQFRNRFAE